MGTSFLESLLLVDLFSTSESEDSDRGRDDDATDACACEGDDVRLIWSRATQLLVTVFSAPISRAFLTTSFNQYRFWVLGSSN